MSMSENDALFRYLLRLADTCSVMSHRLAEWCGHGPILEEDIALSNIALDLIGQARLFYQYAGEVEGKGRDEDQLAMTRPERDYNNLLMVEQPNGDYGETMARQFLFDSYNLLLMKELTKSTDQRIREVADKGVKEVIYHRRHSMSWVLRMGDGTEESHKRVQNGLNKVWGFTDEFFVMDDIDRMMADAGVGPDLESLRDAWETDVKAVIAEATLQVPDIHWRVVGGRHEGKHTEYLGFILAEMQYMQRSYPGLEW